MMSKCTRNLPTSEPCTVECGACSRRAQAGPNHDPLRRTGRTSSAVKSAVMAAALGQRVVYLCGNQNSACHARNVAEEFAMESLDAVARLDRVSLGKDRITFYSTQGEYVGTLVFRSIATPDINRGLLGDQVYRVVEDHFATEVRQEGEKQQRRIDALDAIRTAMSEHGIKSASIDITLTAKTGVPTYTFT